jgi:hypothetical protein
MVEYQKLLIAAGAQYSESIANMGKNDSNSSWESGGSKYGVTYSDISISGVNFNYSGLFPKTS